MTKAPLRPFTWLDAVALLAATALGGAWVRVLYDFGIYPSVRDMFPHLVEMCGPPLATWTVTIAFLRLLPPRPPFHRLALEPGFAACGTIAVLFALECASYLAIEGARQRGIAWSVLSDATGLASMLNAHAVARDEYPVAIATAWGLLFLLRRCRPQPSWIDRVGRGVGLCWIVRAIADDSSRLIVAWVSAGG